MSKLTQEQLEVIRERAEKATKGYWGRVPIVGDDGFFIYGEGGAEAVAERVYMQYDADFIFHAREDVPALLAEVSRLQEEVDRVNNQLGELICAVYEQANEGTALMDLAEAIDND